MISFSSGNKRTDDNEIWVTSTERENDVWSTYVESGVGATKYVAMVDLDGADWPHIKQGQATNRVDVSLLFLVVDAAINSNGRLKVGVIDRVDGTNGDLCYLVDIPFLATTTQLIAELHWTPSQGKMDLGDSGLLHGITNARQTNVAAVNTGLKLDSPAGATTVTPVVGDLVAKLEYVSGGAFNVSLTVFYHTH